MLAKRIGVIMYQTSHTKGQELVAQRMVRQLNQLGEKAYLITSTYHDGMEISPREGLLKDKGYYCVEDDILQIPVIRVDSRLAKWPPRRIVFQEFINTLNQIVNDFHLNVLITHSTIWNGPEETAKFVAWRRNMRNLGGYRDPIVYCHMSHFQEPSTQRYSLSELTFRTAWNKISLSKIIDAANLILVVTPMEKKANLKIGASPEKCVLYPGGVDSEAFLRFAAEDTGDFLRRYNLKPGARIVSYLGTLEERKNPLAILKIAELLKDRPDIHFVLAGRGETGYARDIVQMTRTLPNVSYLGEISDRDKIRLIRASYLNILMSRLEALGITQLEFKYGGVPVITSGVGGQSWVVQDGVDGIHVNGPSDVSGAVEAILQLVDNEELRAQMSRSARERTAKYSGLNITQELDAAIDAELVKESGLESIPSDVSDIMECSEHVLKSWSSGTSGIVATNRQVFIREGVISKRILGIPYQNIRAIEHLRRLPWKIPITGWLLSCLAAFLPSLKFILAPGLVLDFEQNLYNSPILRTISSTNWILASLMLLPFVISLVLFLFEARTGFQLYGAGEKPVYIPAKFKKAIELIRKIQDSGPLQVEKESLSPENLPESPFAPHE